MEARSASETKLSFPRLAKYRLLTLCELVTYSSGFGVTVGTALYLPNPLFAMVSFFAVYQLLLQNTH